MSVLLIASQRIDSTTEQSKGYVSREIKAEGSSASLQLGKE
jgi:hypothetical protein